MEDKATGEISQTPSAASASSPSPAESRNNASNSYIGSFITLISKYEIRYEGVLYHLNLQDSTLGLKNVRSYGTEGRKKDGPQIPPNDRVYEYILFRGSDIKDLQVKSPPSALSEQEITSDRSIVESRYPGVPMSSHSASVGGNSLTRSTQWMDTPAITSKPFPDVQHTALPLSFSPSASVTDTSLNNLPTARLGPSNYSQAAQNAGSSSFSMPLYMQGNKETSANVSHAMNKQPQLLDFNSSPVMGLVNENTSQSITPVPSLVSNPPYPNLSPVTPAQFSTANSLTFPSFSPSPQNNYPVKAQIVGNSFPDPASTRPVQSMPYELAVLTSDPGPSLTPPLSLLSSDQLLQSKQQMLAPRHTMNQAPLPSRNPVPVNQAPLLSGNPGFADQTPLLPLPVLVQQSQYSDPRTQFTEEFDFEAMNEKFQKDEVWGHLGKGKLKQETHFSEESAIEPRSEDSAKPAYKKDDFFDTISCNSLNRGARNVQNRFFDRMKQDTETFGNIQRRAQPGYGDYLAGQGNYRGPYNSSAGYGYYYNGGRGRGRNTQF